MLATEDGVNFHGSVDKIRSKVCVNPIKTVVSHFILIANDQPRVKIKRFESNLLSKDIEN